MHDRHHILLTTVEARDGGQYKTKMYSRGVSSKEGRSCAGWEELCWVEESLLGEGKGNLLAGFETHCCHICRLEECEDLLRESEQRNQQLLNESQDRIRLTKVSEAVTLMYITHTHTHTHTHTQIILG